MVNRNEHHGGLSWRVLETDGRRPQPMLAPYIKIGLIGGVSWVSTLEYCRRINRFFECQWGQLRNPGIVTYSLPFDSILEFQNTGDFESEAAVLIEATRVLEAAGVRFGLICSNTTNKTLRALQNETSIEFLDIVDAVVGTIRTLGLRTVGVLGTKHVMEEGSFYLKRLVDAGFDVRVPGRVDREEVHRVIYEELCADDVREQSRDRLRDMIRGLGAEGCQGVVLGCTELPALLPERAVEGVVLVDSIESHLGALYEAVDALRRSQG
jgi:aspartate racemase